MVLCVSRGVGDGTTLASSSAESAHATGILGVTFCRQTVKLTKAQTDGLYLLILGCLIFVSSALAAERLGIAWMVDFKAIYFGTRCLIEHRDPYQESELLKVFESEGGGNLSDPTEAGRKQAEMLYVNVPTSFLVVAPFAQLKWPAAHLLWMTVTGAALMLSAFLIWSLASEASPILSGALICIWIINCIPLLLLGNAAGIAISFCAIGVWTFARRRFEMLGVTLFSLSIVLKPQDICLVWLFYLLAGGTYRRRAWQIFSLSMLLCLGAIAWTSQSSPNWPSELHQNIVSTITPGGVNDPGPSHLRTLTVGTMTDLQSVLSIFWNNPRFYDAASFTICGALMLLWILAFLRSSSPARDPWLALAFVSCLTLLPVYHRTHDAKLLLLVIPACAFLGKTNARIGRVAALVTTGALVLTGDIPIYILVTLAKKLPDPSEGLTWKVANVVLARPGPLVLLMGSSFFLFAFLFKRPQSSSPGFENTSAESHE